MKKNQQVTSQHIIGGGVKKVIYTLNTVRRIGLLNSAKALKSNNACKACGLGMGGQKGGMTNELGEFPSICNKSVQAQSTDIQPAIPEELFQHTLTDFKQLTGKEMENLGRLNTPLYKAKDSEKFTPVTWQWAIDYASNQLKQIPPERSFFYSSGRSSNEAGFVMQLFARLYGTNNVTNCSFYCHQATGVGLANTIGLGTATVELDDLSNCDLIFVIGANPASNHPRFVHKLKACRDRGGKVIVINPAKEPGLVKFAVPKSARSMISGGTHIASEYIQPNIGSDVSVLQGLAKATIELGAANSEFIANFTNHSAEFLQHIAGLHWQDIINETGLQQHEFMRLAQVYAESERAVFAWGMGITHHKHGVQNVEAISNLALLRGMVGKRYAGLLPLRGHSNVQGIGTIGVKPVLPHEVFTQIEQNLKVKLPTNKGLDTLASLTQAHHGNIDAAFIMGGNLFEATPDSAWTEQAFNAINLKIYLTTTLNKGHVRGNDNGEAIILPVTARDEEWQPTTQESMFNFVRLSDGGIKRLAHPRPEVDIICDIAQQTLDNSVIDFTAYKSHQKIRQAIAKTVPGMEQLDDISVAKQEFHINGRVLHQPTFNTENKKANFIIHRCEPSQVSSKQFPFTMSSVRSEGQFNSIIYEESDSYRGTTSRWVVLMNSDDISNMNLTAGDLVDVHSAHGEMTKVSVVPFDIPHHNVLMYYPEANILIGRETDPRSHTPAFKSVAVAITTASK